MASIAPPETSREREHLLNRFHSVRRATEFICVPLAPEDFVVSATEDTSPPKWHLAHTTWFFERFVLERFKKGYESFRPEFHFLFNSYYRHIGKFLPKSKRNVLSRPGIEEVLKYRSSINQELSDLVSTMSHEDYRRLKAVLEIGINHEEQHQELLLMDIKRNFYENPLRPQYHNHSPTLPTEGSSHQWIHLPSGLYEVGVKKNALDFSYDIEKDAHNVWIDSCLVSSHLVTNEEYLAFIEDGGYENPRFWHSDGWEMKEKKQWHHPLYWEKEGQNWWVMTLAGMVPLELTAPVVHVSYYEAQAYAFWKGARLLRESEWEVCARKERSEGVFLEDSEFDPLPASDDFDEFSQIHGTVWEWTQSAFLPYPRYEKFHHGLGEYNGKFMCNQFILRGGSCLTPHAHYRPTYRNFYYPHQRWQYAGIRLAKELV